MRLLDILKFGSGNMDVLLNAIIGLLFFVNFIRFLFYYLKLMKFLRCNKADIDESILANAQNLWSFINASNEEGVDNKNIEYLRIQVRQSSRLALLFFIAYFIFCFIGFSPNAQSMQDLAGGFTEVGGSVTVPAFVGSIFTGGSMGFTYGLGDNSVEMYTMSLGAGTNAGGVSWEGHVYRGGAMVYEW